MNIYDRHILIQCNRAALKKVIQYLSLPMGEVLPGYTELAANGHRANLFRLRFALLISSHVCSFHSTLPFVECQTGGHCNKMKLCLTKCLTNHLQANYVNNVLVSIIIAINTNYTKFTLSKMLIFLLIFYNENMTYQK